MESTGLKLRTLKKLSAEIGVSQSFLKQLLKEGKLHPHYINSARYISLVEFEGITKSEPQPA